MSAAPVAPSMPLPVGVGHCVPCGRDVEIGADGRCPRDQTLAIWPEGPGRRPDIVTDRLLMLHSADRLDRAPKVPASQRRHTDRPRRLIPMPEGGRR